MPFRFPKSTRGESRDVPKADEQQDAAEYADFLVALLDVCIRVASGPDVLVGQAADTTLGKIRNTIPDSSSLLPYVGRILKPYLLCKSIEAAKKIRNRTVDKVKRCPP